MPASVAEPAERLLSTELQERLTGYPGQWAAVLNDEIVAVAETPKEAYDMGREAVGDADEMILHRVPDDSNVAYFF